MTLAESYEVILKIVCGLILFFGICGVVLDELEDRRAAKRKRKLAEDVVRLGAHLTPENERRIFRAAKPVPPNDDEYRRLMDAIARHRYRPIHTESEAR